MDNVLNARYRMVLKRGAFFVLAVCFLSFVSACSSGGKKTPFEKEEFDQVFGVNPDDGSEDGTVDIRPEIKTEDDEKKPPAETGEPTIAVIGENLLKNLRVGATKKVRIKLDNFSGDFKWKFEVKENAADIKVELKDGLKQYLVVTPSKEGTYTIDLKAVALDGAETIIAAKTITAQAYLLLTIGNSSLGEMLLGDTFSVSLTITGGNGQYVCEKAEVTGGGITVGFQKEGSTCKATFSNAAKPGIFQVYFLVGDSALGEKAEKTIPVTVKEDFAVNAYVVNNCGSKEPFDLRTPRSIALNEMIAIVVNGHDTGYSCSWDNNTGFSNIWDENPHGEELFDPSKVDWQGKLACLFHVPNELFAPQTPQDPTDYTVRGAAIVVKNASGGSSETVQLLALTFTSGFSSDAWIKLVLKSSNIANIIMEPSTTLGFAVGKEFSSTSAYVQERSFFKAQFAIEGGRAPFDIQCLDANGGKDPACVVTIGFNLFFVADYDPRTFDVWIFNNTSGSHYLHIKDDCSFSTDNTTKIEFFVPQPDNIVLPAPDDF